MLIILNSRSCSENTLWIALLNWYHKNVCCFTICIMYDNEEVNGSKCLDLFRSDIWMWKLIWELINVTPNQLRKMTRRNHLLLLLWKNYLLQKRKVVVTILEIGIPTLFAVILILIRQRVSSEEVRSPTSWKKFTLDFPDDVIRSQFNLPWELDTLYFSPNITLAHDIMSTAQKRLQRITS